ncbi:Aste57867_13523 [Aphanomyces stellatus]|uniref:Aste57867_13523 protein n=1 Tax=Aphanomyces stellatus TaxID=120398 RepID=A0A485KYW0_9STRA|nr:hypothetical protein As57867_013473 [Aphanomyces stellatus]VFT90361.1 Aste57867_13523 [Aphanomyces stellatus]
MSAFEALFGPSLLTKAEANATKTNDHLQGKTVGIYFSAHWCPPCRHFTPILATYYKTMQSKGVPFEIVFVSSDKDQAAFDEYYGEMPWAAVPYAARDVHEALNAKYKVQGIPTLVLIDAYGDTINANARGKIMSDLEGNQFPYVPKTLPQLLGNAFINKANESFTTEALKGKHLGLYFSASWCGPCQHFTPHLAMAYDNAKAAGHDLEIVFVSGDRDSSSFDAYRQKMPWLALPFDAAQSAYEELTEMFGVEGIPHLVVLGPNRGPIRPVVNKNAVSLVSSDPAAFPWAPKPVVDLAHGVHSGGFSINEKPSLIVFCESLDADAQKTVVAALTTLASESAKGVVCKGDVCTISDEPSAIFFTNTDRENGVGQQIQQFVGMDETPEGVYAVLLDIPERQYFVHTGAVDEATLRSLLADYGAKTLQTKTLGQ